MALATRPKPTRHHHKRQGTHHRHSKPYLKTYWPYLPMLMIVGLGIMVNALWSNHSVLGANRDFSAHTLLANTNADRVLDNEQPLTIDSQLTDAAQAKAEDMVSKDYWSHNAPSGRTPWSFITAAGYQYQAAGENLAYGFNGATAVVTAWMNSPEHRANILDVNYQNVGFGVASSPNYQGHGPATVVVAEYGEPAAGSKPVFTASTTPTTSAPSTRELNAQPVARIQLLTGGQANWSLFAVSTLASVALIAFVVQHGLRFRRLVVEGETWVAHHPLFDIAIVFVFTAGFVLTRTSGMIR
ncbi:MAG TPA: CAP domain-containing protein [Candidatus Saccharimonadales bacterium]|nr:CAP domain-containing protein [Candidatus Saccharimonadales bacterium]